MAYEYEKENIRKLNSYNVLSGGTNITKTIDEIQKVYKKARAFDEILSITQLQHEEEYAEDVISVIDKYKEDE